MSMLDLQLRMYMVLALVFAIGFGIMYAVLSYFGAGTIVILAFAIGIFALQWYISPELMKMMAHLRYISDSDYPKLHSMVTDLANGAHVAVPKIAIAPTSVPNAFVFGRTVKSATLVVHEGILNMLDDNELKAVLAHEIGHLKHNDVWVITFISFIPMVGWILAQNLFFGGMFGGNRNNGAALIALGVAGFFIYFLSQMLIMAFSRMRETFADEYSAVTTRKPEHLASSLLKITGANAVATPQQSAKSQTVAKSFYLVDGSTSKGDMEKIEEHKDDIKRLLPSIDINELVSMAKSETKGMGGITSMFATHPATYKRILFLAQVKKTL